MNHSEIFEGENSSLRKAFGKVTSTGGDPIYVKAPPVTRPASAISQSVVDSTNADALNVNNSF